MPVEWIVERICAGLAVAGGLGVAEESWSHWIGASLQQRHTTVRATGGARASFTAGSRPPLHFPILVVTVTTVLARLDGKLSQPA